MPPERLSILNITHSITNVSSFRQTRRSLMAIGRLARMSQYNLPSNHDLKRNYATSKSSTSLESSQLDVRKQIDAFEETEELLRLGRLDSAVCTFQQGLSDGLLPSAPTCDRLIASLCSKRRFLDARKVYRGLRSASLPLKYNTFQGVLDASLRMGAIGEALDVFQDLKRQGHEPNLVTYCGLISALGKRRRRGLRSAELAYQLWQELLSSPQRFSLDAVAVRTGMKACVDVGRLQEAEELLDRAERSGSSASRDVRSYNILLHGYANSGDLASMIELLTEIQTKKIHLSSITYNTLIGAYAKAGDLARARMWMEEAIYVGIKLDAWSYTLILQGYIKRGEINAATEVLHDMEHANIKPTFVTYSALIDAYVKKGDMVKALQMLNQMFESGETPSAVTYNSLLKGFARTCEAHPQLRDALSLLEDMQAAGVMPTVDTMNTLMSAALDIDDAALALDIYSRFRDTGLQPDGFTYTSLIKAHARRGDLPEAVAAFEALSSDRSATMDIAAYNAMVDALTRCGEMEAAEAMLQRTSAFAQRNGLVPSVEAYGSIVYGYVKLNQVQAAVGAVRRFHAVGGTPDMQMLDQVADMCVRNGEFKLAMQSVRAIELLGGEVDKSKYKSLFEKRMARQSNYESARVRKGSRREEASERMVHIERFKFWLGLPNRYYSSGLSDDNE